MMPTSVEPNALQASIRTAIGEGCYVMLLLDAVQTGTLKADMFPKKFEVRTIDEDGHQVGEVLQLTSPLNSDLLLRYHENLGRMALGSCVVKVSAALEQKFGKNPTRVHEPDAQAAFVIVKSARHAWAHQPQGPIWKIHENSKKPWAVRPLGLTVDLTQANGKPVSGRDFGGWTGFYKLILFCDSLVAEGK